MSNGSPPASHDLKASGASPGFEGAARPTSGGQSTGPAGQSLVRRAIEWVMVTGVVYALSLAYSVLLNRALGPAERGRLAVVLAVATAGNGLLNAGLGVVGRALVAQDPSRFLPIHRSLGRYSLLLAAVGGGLAVFVWTADMLPMPSSRRHLISLGIAAVPLLVYGTFWQWLCQGAGRFRTINIQRLIKPTLDLFCIVLAFVFFLRSAETAAASWILAGSMAATLAFLQVRGRREPKQQGPLFGDMLRPALPMALANLLVGSQPQITLLFLASQAHAAATGVYASAFGLAFHLGTLVATGAMVSADRLGGGLRVHAAEHAARLGRFTFALALAAGLLLSVVGTPILSLLYGREFAWGGPLLAMLAAGLVVSSVLESLTQYIVAHEPRGTRLCLRLNCMNLVFFAALLYMGSTPFSSYEAAATLALSYIANAAVYSFVVAGRSGLPFRHFVLLNRADLGGVLRWLASRG